MLSIIGGKIYDPLNGINGQIDDIWIKTGKIVSSKEIIPSQTKTIDASGLIVMPGGVDIHSHITGAKVNSGRKLCPEEHPALIRVRGPRTRSGVGFTVPTTYLTGYLYAEMGYTTVMEAAAAPLVARHTHEELQDTPLIDKGVFITMGNNHFIMKCIRDKTLEKARDYVAWLLGASKGFAIKIVNPGGVENWKYGQNVKTLNDEVIGFGVTPKQIITTLARINDQLNLPHVLHIHGLNLGQSGNAEVTIETMAALEGLQAHFCHLHFMSYAGQLGKAPKSGAVEVARKVNACPNITIDVGQIVFGPATTMTSDGPVQYNLSRQTGNKWFNDDLESESGGGVVPIIYSPKNPFHAAMWLTGLELFLLVDDPWKVFLTTDHPNAGPFVSYPQVISLLMDRAYRADAFSKLHRSAQKHALLPKLDREYTLYEIAIITRAGTARRLGLTGKGHLGEGADADVTIYAESEDKAKMFARPRWVIKNGEVIVSDGCVDCGKPGRTMYVAPSYDRSVEKDIQTHFKQSYTVSFENYSIEENHIGPSQQIETV